MKVDFRIREASNDDLEVLIEMCLLLFKETTREEQRNQILKNFPSPVHKFLLVETSNQTHGFAIFSIRHDYVEGAKDSPTGYLEGIYLQPEARNKGIARALVEKGEAWAKSKGCTQMGSDTWLSDTQSRAFHKKLGFIEEEELVHFIKDLP